MLRTSHREGHGLHWMRVRKVELGNRLVVSLKLKPKHGAYQVLVHYHRSAVVFAPDGNVQHPAHERAINSIPLAAGLLKDRRNLSDLFLNESLEVCQHVFYA